MTFPAGILPAISSSSAIWSRALGVSLDVDDVMEMENVRDVVRVIQAKLQQA